MERARGRGWERSTGNRTKKLVLGQAPGFSFSAYEGISGAAEQMWGKEEKLTKDLMQVYVRLRMNTFMLVDVHCEHVPVPTGTRICVSSMCKCIHMSGCNSVLCVQLDLPGS